MNVTFYLLLIILLLLIYKIYLLSSFTIKSSNDKVLIYSKPYMLTEGAFGMGLIYTLQAVEILNNENINPKNVVFDVNSKLYGKLVPGMMNPKVISNVTDFDTEIQLNQMTSQIFKKIDRNRTKEDYFETYNKLFNKWFSIPKEVFSKVPKFNGKKTLGIHYRGTDKTNDRLENTAITSDEFIIIINDFLNKHKNIKNIFIATDDANFIPLIENKFPDNEIIQYDQTRSRDGKKSLHKSTKFNGNDKIINPWIDVVALSRCEYVLKISSALSAWAKIINPNLKIYQVNATRQIFAPTCFIPSYHSDTPEVKKILDRTLKGNYF